MFDIFSGPEAKEIQAKQLEEKISNEEEIMVLDVRNSSEYKKNSIDAGKGSVYNYSARKVLKDLPEEVKRDLTDQEVIVVCYKGNISQKVAAKLDSRIENEVKSLSKGMKGWNKLEKDK